MTVLQGSKPQIPRLSAHEISQAWPTVEEHGAVIVENFLSQSIVERLNGEVESIFQASSRAETQSKDLPKDFLPPTVKWTNNLAASSKTFRQDILNHDAVHDICRCAFKDTGDYWLITSTILNLGPNNVAQQLHRDYVLSHPLLRHLRPDAPTLAMNFLVALSPFTAENGATNVILGSHKWPEIGTPSSDQVVQAVMNPGDALIITALTVHGGAANVTAGNQRQFLTLGMGACQLTPHEAHMAIPRPIVESLTPLAQRMLGWRSPRIASTDRMGLLTVQESSLESYMGLKTNQPLEEV